MSLTTIFTPAILDTILGRLALLFLTGANGDHAEARDAARRMLAAYNVETAIELRLAAEIVSFSFHALEALSQASHPDMSLTKILRLRGSAVSLSRESHKSQRKLDQLQNDRRTGIPAQPAETPAAEPSRPRIDKALALIEATREAIIPAAKSSDQTWSKSYQQRQTARRITENLKKNQAIHAAANPSAPAASPGADLSSAATAPA